MKFTGGKGNSYELVKKSCLFVGPGNMKYGGMVLGVSDRGDKLSAEFSCLEDQDQRSIFLGALLGALFDYVRKKTIKFEFEKPDSISPATVCLSALQEAFRRCRYYRILIFDENGNFKETSVLTFAGLDSNPNVRYSFSEPDPSSIYSVPGTAAPFAYGCYYNMRYKYWVYPTLGHFFSDKRTLQEGIRL